MKRRIATSFSGLRVLPSVILAAVIGVTACTEEKTDVVHREVDGNTVPTMMTDNVVTLISDSGVTRYRITAPLWLVFDEADEPQWRFPEGMFLEKFDDKFSTEATIVCDSATYFKNKGLWRLDGDVNVLNTLNEKFLSQQIFWDQRSRKVYSDSFIHIEKSDRIIEGYGFNSNERMTTYSINKPSGIFPVSDFKGHRDSVAGADSVAQPVAEAPAPAPAADNKAKAFKSAPAPVKSDRPLRKAGLKPLRPQSLKLEKNVMTDEAAMRTDTFVKKK